MADVKDPKITEGPFPSLSVSRKHNPSVTYKNPYQIAYEQVRKNEDDTMWLILDYASDKSDALTLTKTGTGGLDEFAENLDPQRASFGYVRVKYVRTLFLSTLVTYTTTTPLDRVKANVTSKLHG